MRDRRKGALKGRPEKEMVWVRAEVLDLRNLNFVQVLIGERAMWIPQSECKK